MLESGHATLAVGAYDHGSEIMGIGMALMSQTNGHERRRLHQLCILACTYSEWKRCNEDL